MKSITECRVCGNGFFPEPLMRYENMPKAAQFLPDESDLESDRGVDLEICQCSGCGLVQLSNEPVPYYREVIRAAAFSEDMKRFRLQQFRGFVEDFSLAGRKIVEIGCGKGEYLALMQQFASGVYGLEQSEDSVKSCLARGLAVERGFFEDAGYLMEHAPFDAFFILNFLEHIPDINQALRGIYNNLSEGAVGLVEVPNFDMILRNKLFSEFIGDHLYYFTTETLATALRLNGFEVLQCREVWHEYIISAIVKKRQKLDLSGFDGAQARLKDDIEKYVSSFREKSVAVWGAGHQALAVISLAAVADKIRYVVDSAPFKQGRFTPATHLRIVAPERLDTEPVEAVIVMAASYSDEVAKIIQEKFAGNMNISIVRDFGLEIVQDCR